MPPSHFSGEFADRLREKAAEMERAADLDERDEHRRVTRFDAREWAEDLRELATQPLDRHDDVVEARLLERLQRDGLLKAGMTATDARSYLDG